MALEFAGATDVGRRRDHNEDALLVLPQHKLAAVCDGMGGYRAGEIASGIGVETVRRFFEIVRDPLATWPFRYDVKKDEPTNLLSVAARWANQRILQAGEADRANRGGMGTTLVAVLFAQARAYFGWIGDSRGYILRRGELHPTTSDHSLVNEMIRAGQLRADQIATYPHKNVITRALGMAEDIDVDVNAFDLESGDVCLVCCDGLTGMVEDERIAEILTDERELERACQALIAEANGNGGLDNITVALARYTT